MTSRLPGVVGELFPSRYLADRLPNEEIARLDETFLRRSHATMAAWWSHVHQACGPASGVRTLFDLAAMPLAAFLGFQANNATFEATFAKAHLFAPDGSPVGLLVTRWAVQPSRNWRDAAAVARDLDTDWCFIVAPPYVSLVRVCGGALRASLDFALPEALDPRSVATFLMLMRAETYEWRGVEKPAAIELLLRSASDFQDGVRADLQIGVVEALRQLTLVSTSTAGFDESLTIVYRILFLLFAESRDLVPHRHPVYRGAYAVATLCREALRANTPGVWEGLAAISRLSRTGCRTGDLIVRPFNGRLFARRTAPTLERARRRLPRHVLTARDTALHTALVSLATRRERGRREEICYADLGVEQLGAVYERVLDLDPKRLVEADVAAETWKGRRHSDRRKQTGTFYTPQPLAEFVVRRTLAPLVAGRSADEILELRVVDPSMGSGAFLVAACRFLAAAYARAIVDEGRCADGDLDADAHADIRRLIAERCLAGVDSNPVAVQLARLSLWLATLARAKPLGFLDHRLRIGNSLVGASPDDLWRVPARRRADNGPDLPLLADLDLEFSLRRLVQPLCEFARTRDDTVETVRAKELAWTKLTSDRSVFAKWRLAAHLWCARWFWPVGQPPSAMELRAGVDAIVRRDATLPTDHVDKWSEVARVAAAKYRFFHWPIEFADVFFDADGRPKARPGFDAVIGNPPWEMLRDDGTHGGAKSPTHGGAKSSALLQCGDNRRLVRFIRESGLYPSCDRGHVNLYQPFLERALSIARTGGRVGLVVPWGLAVDDGATALRAMLLDRSNTDTLVGLDNGAGMFPIHRGLRFAVLVTSPGSRTREIRARFGVRTANELEALSGAHEPTGVIDGSYPVRLSPAVIANIGGSQRRVPDLRRPADLSLLEQLNRSFPRLGDVDGWAARFGRELNVTEDRASFAGSGLPVIEGKHVRPFGVDARHAAFRIGRAVARRLQPRRDFEHPRLAYRDVSAVGNRVTLIAAVVPADVITTHTLFCLKSEHTIEQQYFLCGLFNSDVLNAVVRLLMGSHVTTSLVEGLPVPKWTASAAQRRIARISKRLSQRYEPLLHARLQTAVARLYEVGT